MNNLSDYRELTIDESKFEELRNNCVFIDILNLARIEDALAFCKQNFSDYTDGTLVAKRQRNRALIFMIGVLIEALRNIQNLTHKYSSGKLFESQTFIGEFEKLLAKNNVKDFMKNFGARIRDNTAFHFDKKIIKKALKQENGFKRSKYVFCASESDSPNKLNYSLANELDLHYHFIVASNKKSEESIKEEILEETMRILDEYMEIADKFITEQIIQLLK